MTTFPYSYALSFNEHRTTLFISSHFTLWFCILNYFAGQAKLRNIQPNPVSKNNGFVTPDMYRALS